MERRKKGTGSIFKRGDVYYFKQTINGNRKILSLGVSHKQDKTLSDGTIIKGAATLATEKINRANEIRKKEDYIKFVVKQRAIISDSALKIDKAFDTFSPIYRMKHNTSENSFMNYIRQWNRFETWLAENHPEIEELRQVTEDIAREYWQIFSSLASSTANQHLTTLKTVFETLKKEADLLLNPWDAIPRRPADGISRKYMSKNDIQNLKNSFLPGGKNEFVSDEYKGLFLVGRYIGQRLADCALLQQNEVQLDKKMIYLYPRKTIRRNRPVTIPILPELYDYLKIRMETLSGSFVFPSIAAEFMKYPDGVKRTVSAIFQRAGFTTSVLLPGRTHKTSVFGFHCFRGTLGTDMLNAGFPAFVVSQVLGDNIATIEKHYAKRNEDALRQAFAQFTSVLNPG